MTGEGYRELGEAAWAWVLGQVRDYEGPWLPEVVPGEGPPAGPGADRDSVHAGIGGLAPVLAELGQHRALTGAEQVLAAGIVARPGAMVPARTEPSLYDGLGGDATALKLLAPGSEQAALARLAELMRNPRPGRGTLAVHRASPGPAAAAAGHLMDAGRRGDRRVPAPHGPRHGRRADRRPRGRSPGPVVGRPGPAAAVT